MPNRDIFCQIRPPSWGHVKADWQQLCPITIHLRTAELHMLGIDAKQLFCH